MTKKRKRLNTIVSQLEDVEAKRNELWERYGKATSYKKEEKIRQKVHPLDLIKRTLFIQLWDAYEDFPDEVDFVGIVYSPSAKIEFDIYCDGEYHFVVNPKNEELRYGYECQCE